MGNPWEYAPINFRADMQDGKIFYVDQPVPCHGCQATGYQAGEPCPKCRGTGIYLARVRLGTALLAMGLAPGLVEKLASLGDLGDLADSNASLASSISATNRKINDMAKLIGAQEKALADLARLAASQAKQIETLQAQAAASQAAQPQAAGKPGRKERVGPYQRSVLSLLGEGWILAANGHGYTLANEKGAAVSARPNAIRQLVAWGYLDQALNLTAKGRKKLEATQA
jgi:hypothetical protein